MARYEDRFWEPTHDYTLPRRRRRGGRYRAYVPDNLVGRQFVLGGDVAADVADAEREIVAFDKATPTLVNTETLARLLLRAESVASSRIEGLVIRPRRLLRADAARQMGDPVTDVTETEVLANVDAMAAAMQAVDDGRSFSVELLRQINTELLKGTAPNIAGVIRTTQNWIGQTGGPLEADYIPPPPEFVIDLLQDLCDFSNSDTLPALAQAAIAHAQFEAIHPFPDGNGRVGRALIHMILRRRGLTTHVSPPISLALATFSKDYIDGLTATHYIGESHSKDATEGTDKWVETFAGASRRAVRDATLFERRIHDIQARWTTALGQIRSDSAAAKLIAALPGTPIISPAGAAQLLGRSLQATLEGIDRLASVGILTPTKVGRKRGQVYEARAIIEEFALLERQLASPGGNTQIEQPVRPVPQLSTSAESGPRAKAR